MPKMGRVLRFVSTLYPGNKIIVTRDYYCPSDFALCLNMKETAVG